MRRVLIVSYYFPPSGGPGVQRVLKFVKYLRDFGYEPTVLTVKEGAYPQHDAELAREIPAGVAVHRTRSVDPFEAYARLTGRSKKDAVMVGSVRRDGGLIEKAASWLRANVFLPDARVGWVPFAVREGLRLHNEKPFDVLLTSGPPHSVHLIGRKLKRKTGFPWVADFRDLWTDTNFYDDLPISGFARRYDQRLERSVLTEADRITTVSPYWKEVLTRKSGRPDAEVAVVHNGFDGDDFGKRPEPSDDETGVFTLAHIGSLYGARNPETLWAAVRQLRDDKEVEHLRIQLVGTVDEKVREAVRLYRLGDVVAVHSYVSHTEATKNMCEASALLLVIEPFEHAMGMITGKLYEYLASGQPVLGIGPADGDAAGVIAEVDAGTMCSWGDVDAVAANLKLLYSEWEDGHAISGASLTAMHAYSRRSQAEVLAEHFDEVLSSSA